MTIVLKPYSSEFSSLDTLSLSSESSPVLTHWSTSPSHRQAGVHFNPCCAHLHCLFAHLEVLHRQVVSSTTSFGADSWVISSGSNPSSVPIHPCPPGDGISGFATSADFHTTHWILHRLTCWVRLSLHGGKPSFCLACFCRIDYTLLCWYP